MTTGAIAFAESVRTFRLMTNKMLPDASGHHDPRHTFLTSKEVTARFGAVTAGRLASLLGLGARAGDGVLPAAGRAQQATPAVVTSWVQDLR